MGGNVCFFRAKGAIGLSLGDFLAVGGDVDAGAFLPFDGSSSTEGANEDASLMGFCSSTTV